MNTKFQIDQSVPFKAINGIHEGVIKGIRITGEQLLIEEDGCEIESYTNPWKYTLEYNVFYLRSLNDDYKCWVEWGWLTEEDIDKAQLEKDSEF